MNDKAIETLNDLIKICVDGHNGYRDAAENVEDPELKALFRDLAAKREQVLRDLQRHVQRLGGEPADRGTASGGAHNMWVKLKGSVGANDRKSIVDDVERGEDVAVREFQNALDQDLPDEVATAIRQNFAEVKADHDRVSALKHRMH